MQGLNFIQQLKSELYHIEKNNGNIWTPSLSTGLNLLNIKANKEKQGLYSISCFEFEKIIAGIILLAN
jgi:hypothetical protein